MFGYGVFHAHSQNVKEKVKKNTEDIEQLRESVVMLLRAVELEKLDKEYIKESVKRIEKNMAEVKKDVKEILLAK